MTALLHAELLKLRTTRTFAAVTGLAVLTSVVLTVLVSLLTEPRREDVLVDVFTNDTSSLFILVLAVVGITGEWRHRTIVSSLLAAPRRLELLAAKVVAFAIAGLVMALTISLAVAAIGATILSLRDLPLPAPSDLVAQIGRNGLLSLLLGGLGVVVGAIVRHQLAAIVAVLVLTFGVDSALLSLAPEVGRFSPFGGLGLAVQDLPEDAMGIRDGVLLPPGLAALALLGWIAALYAVAGALLHRRDLT